MSEHKEEEAFETFVDIIAKLRGENGCPWDKEQTFESLKPCMVNEMTEALAGIDLYTQTGNAENLCEELGDVLMQVVLLSQIAREKGLFDITDVIKGISEKMAMAIAEQVEDKKDMRQAMMFLQNYGITMNLAASSAPESWSRQKRLHSGQQQVRLFVIFPNVKGEWELTGFYEGNP